MPTVATPLSTMLALGHGMSVVGYDEAMVESKALDMGRAERRQIRSRNNASASAVEENGPREETKEGLEPVAVKGVLDLQISTGYSARVSARRAQCAPAG